MKRVINLTVLTVILLAINTGYAQESKILTSEFHVEGVCNSCKERIENAAYIKGVKFCEWNKETEVLKVIYDPEKVSIDLIHAKIAQIGHSTDKVTADSIAYTKLPKCCAYNEVSAKH